MLKVLNPITTATAMVAVSDAPTSTASEWVSGAAYAAGDLVKRDARHRIYKRLLSGAGTMVPESDVVNWVDAGPTNDWAMFDSNVNTRTKGSASGLHFSVTPGMACNGVALLDLVSATELFVSCDYSKDNQTSNENSDVTTDYAYGITLRTVVSSTRVSGSNPARYVRSMQMIYSIKLEYRNASDWKSFFTEPYQLKSDVFLAFPSRKDYTISVSCNQKSPEIGSFVIGNFVELGDVGYGATAGVEDYSSIVTDQFGVSKLTSRGYVKRATYPITVKNDHINRAFSTLAAVLSKPTVFVGSDDYRLSPLTVFGHVANFEMSLSFPSYSIFNVEIKGLTL